MTAATMQTTPRQFAIFLPALSGGGAERAMVNLAGGLLARGVRVDLVLARATGPYLASVPAGVRIVDLGANKILPKIRALARYLKETRPHGLISCLDNINVASVAQRMAGVQTRVLMSVQNHVSKDLASHGQLKGRLAVALMQWMYPRADGVIAVSHGVADDLVDELGLPRDLVSVIHNPMVNSRINELAAEPVDHPFFAPGAPPVLLGMGRMTQQKDFPTLLRAFAIVRAKRPVRLLILGEGEHRASLESLAGELGITAGLSLPGFVDNPYAYLAKARLFVLSSLWEGLPTVVMESLAAGTAVVSTDCPSGPREILADGAFGELAPMSDPDALAAAIERSLSVEPDRDALRARAQLYSADLSVDRYLAALDAGGPPRTASPHATVTMAGDASRAKASVA
ncbi:MAG TPA: glycosyltransferase [Tepidisphaeraceae bacterium]|jgi:glycosyltransferase involved in cell wall biosynthesis|nr:glycosyltransferase [Tepidisphaeraceae bacterium]